MFYKKYSLILTALLHLVAAFEIWPHPKVVIRDNEFFSIDPKNFTIHLKTKGKCEVLEKAIIRYQSRMFVQDCSILNEKFRGRFFFNTTQNFEGMKGFVDQLNNIILEVEQECETSPHVNMNETYSIKITKSNSLIYSRSVWGAIRGLETLSQMIKQVGKDQFKLHIGEIQDSPRFGFRGLLIDTSRHFLPLHSIYETLDAMEMNKLNVLHWHIVDDESFPFVSKTFPNLSKKGAFKNSYIYSVEDVSNVIKYASERGIRVIPEFDTPGHTKSWGKGQPNLLTQCYIHEKLTKIYGPINPTLNSTYEFIQKFFHEIAQRFPDQYIHLGGDEVNFTCWKSNPAVKEFMKLKQFNNDYRKLESYYIQKLIDIVHNLNRSYIVWQEVFDNQVAIRPETVIHVWKRDIIPTWEMEMNEVTRAGYHALLSSCWYLNYISYGSDWYKYYQCDPQNFNATSEQRKLVIGGEACMWGEYVDASNLISRTWPRTCAVAERLWSDKNFNDYYKAIPRFHIQRCRMQVLGLHVEPIEGPDFCWCDDAL